MLISFEGVDGAGKTTQITRLERALEARGEQVVCTRHPGGTKLGKGIRELFLAPDEEHPITVEAETALMAADFSMTYAHIIRPALAAGKVVLTDRAWDSSIAYQGASGGNKAVISEVGYTLAHKGLLPDLTIWLDVPPEVALARQTKKNRLEAKGLGYQLDVRAIYLELRKSDPGRWVQVKGDENEDVVARAVLAAYDTHRTSR